jgi:hypothetical protein
VRGGVCQRLDDLELFEDRARPAVRDDDGQRISCGDRTWMKWMSSPSIPVMKFGNR